MIIDLHIYVYKFILFLGFYYVTSLVDTDPCVISINRKIPLSPRTADQIRLYHLSVLHHNNLM